MVENVGGVHAVEGAVAKRQAAVEVCHDVDARNGDIIDSVGALDLPIAAAQVYSEIARFLCAVGVPVNGKFPFPPSSEYIGAVNRVINSGAIALDR